MKRLTCLVAVSLAFAGAAAACSSTPEAEEPDPSTLCASGQAPPGQYCASAAPTTTVTTTVTATQTQTASASATPIPPLAAAAATPVMQGLAAQEAPGMQPDGGPFAGQFQEGQTLEQPINISPGKCYTIVGVGIGIQELDIQLVTQPVPNAPPIPLAQDSTTGAQATVGGKASGCWRNPTPLGAPGKVILRATKGAGIGMAQVYIK
jgi:hypothetical protein